MTSKTVDARAVYFDAPGSVSVRTETVSPRQGEALVTSDLIGISHGTELLFYRGPFPSGHLLEARAGIGADCTYPIKYGYMNVGRLEDGSRVFAFHPHQDRFSCQQSDLLPIPDDIECDDAIFYASMETALQIVHDTHARIGEVVLVTGLGVIGLLVTRLLRLSGIDVVASDPVEARRSLARSSGCDVINPVADDALAMAAEITENRGYDLVVNTSSSSEALQYGIDTVGTEGAIIEASWYGDASTSLHLGASFHRKRISIRSSQVSNLNPQMVPRWSRERRTALVWRMIRALGPQQLISHRFQLQEAPQVYQEIDEHPERVMQVVLIP